MDSSNRQRLGTQRIHAILVDDCKWRQAVRLLKQPPKARLDDSDEKSFPPPPEEGVRLIRAFHSIKKAAVRNAIIKIVEELSRKSSTLPPTPE
jgi:hypothetical protein